LPKRYQILDPKENILLGPGQVELWDTFDVWVIVDTNDPRRLGKLWNELSLRAKKVVFLDHHPPIAGVEPPALTPNAMVVADTTSSSIAELLHQLFAALDLTKLNKDMALGLYVSVMTDTNSFRYARTTPMAHEIAAEMIELGVDPEAVYQAIFSSKEVSHLKLLGHMLQNVQIKGGGRLAWLAMVLALRREHRASADDTQSFLNLLLLLRDAEVVCLFREEDEGHVRVSIKSKGRVIVNKLAMELGGGGHEYAAGLQLEMPLQKAVDLVTERLATTIDSFEKFGK
jgi:phosphoesterase RecJ-like protein